VNSPRFLFVAGFGRGVEAHPAWPDVHQPFRGTVNGDQSWVAWRLTGANHREIGRSSRVFPDVELAHLDAEAIRVRIADAKPQILTVPRTTSWGWRLMVDDVAVVTSSRGFARHGECAYNVSTFIAAVSRAHFDLFGSRGWRETT
jgi:hypothetical protein